MRKWSLEDQRGCFIAILSSFYLFLIIDLLVSQASCFLSNCHFQQPDDLESGFASDVESKYKKIYEDDINPFAAFSKKVVIVELL